MKPTHDQKLAIRAIKLAKAGNLAVQLERALEEANVGSAASDALTKVVQLIDKQIALQNIAASKK